MQRVQRATEDIQREIDRVRALPAGKAEFCIVIEGMFSDASIDLAFIGKVAELDNKLPQIAFIFDEHLQFADVVSTVSIDMSPLLVKAAAAITALTALTAPTVAAIFGPVGAGLVIGAGILLYNAIDNHIDAEGELREALHEKGPLVASYVRGFLERLSAIGAVALGCQLRPAAADDGADVLRISYYDPAEARPPRPLQDVGQIADVGPLDSTLALRAAAAMTFPAPGGIRRSAGQAKPAVTYSAEHGRARRARHVLRAETPGPPPDDFVIRDPDTLHRLDRHDTIVILMMENRSFDHYFYDLAAELPGRGYEAPPDGFANPPPPGLVEPLRPYRNDTIGIGHTLIFRGRNGDRFLDPSHNFDHTMFQIGGGTAETAGSGQMLGFARDLALKSDSPQLAMGYFGLDSLPTFRVLAEHYAVCTRWFASLPVGTQPNRLSAFQGNVPFLYNLHMDDPSLGFLEDYSLFDLLDSQDIDWLFFEGDIGTIRLYDRFRLNVRNVRPLTELGRTLRNARDTGRLPRLIVIEPEFLFGYDDHPPMDIRDGQDFIRDVVGQFLHYGLLDRVLFAITYDEHGGFFDHVPPPGTQSGDPAWIGQVADLYPEAPQTAPDCMGVRVPSIVMSRFVSPEAKATILDHTSILKTILLHNRHRISTNQFARFGERVMRGAHLAELMDLEEPRTVDHSAIALDLGYRPWLPRLPWFDVRPSRLLNGLAAGWNPTDPARVLHNIAAPRAKRFVSDVPPDVSR